MTDRPTYAELLEKMEALEKEFADYKQRTTDLMLQRTHLELLIQNSAIAIVILDDKGSIVSCNRHFEELFRFKESEILGKNLDHLIAGPRFMDDAASYSKKTFRGEPSKGSGKRCRQDGTVIDVEFFAIPVILDEKVIGSYGIYQDISKRLQAETALNASEEKYKRLYDESRRTQEVYQSLLHTSADAIITYDMEGKVTYTNSAFTKIFGWTLKEIKGKRLPFVPESEKNKSLDGIRRIVEEGAAIQGFETKRYAKDGRLIDVNISGSRYNDHKGNPGGMLAIIRDTSEKKRLETQIHQAQKMESIGTLAGGVAHDFNNLLMGMQGRTSLLLMGKDLSHPDFRHLKGIEENIKSAADLTRQLLGFARGGQYEVKPTDLNEIVDKSVDMFGRTKKEIKIHIKSQKGIWTVAVDQTQIEQVLLNLYVNAWQAMSGTGELFLETENVTLEENDLKPYLLAPGRYVKISVTDTGIGMDEAMQQRIFDPFFTTKEIGRGTGLGLASAYGIIKNHDGLIKVYSKKGKGATFTIYLPASKKKISDETEMTGEIVKGTETVLLVDDEMIIIDIGKALLEALGYTVLLAKSGKECLTICRKNQDKIDLVILDMIMPEMSGSETYDRLKEINPKIKVLLSSGYSINGLAKTILARGCNGFIQKPYSIKKLSEMIRKILKGK